MTRKCVESVYKHFEIKNFLKNVQKFDVVCRMQFEFWHVFEEVFDFKVLVKTFDTFSSHVIGI